MRSKLAILIIVVVLFSLRTFYSEFNGKAIMLTSYDALGYYTYLPALFVYDDCKKLDWLDEIGETYGISGSALNKGILLENGNRVNKYFLGVSMMQSPFFAIAHTFAEKKDGFSWPYQWSIVFASFFYSILGLFFLRKVLLRISSDTVVALTLILIILASNIIQYIAIDCGLTHSYLFFLYCLVIYLSQRWHREPRYFLSLLIGACIGLAVCVRPTELLMILIPLLWRYPQDNKSSKGTMLSDKKHLILAGLGGAVMLLPQSIYWYGVTGSFIYDVGSKWSFANPFFRVLFGWEKGWFIYTPVTILFVISLFYVKSKPFGLAIKTFILLNIYVVISWFDWRYGGSYSTRALSQSYPVFGLALASMLSSCHKYLYRFICFVLAPLLIVMNLVQVYQYNETILHYDHMNKKYYQAIFMNVDPTPLDYSLLDTEDMQEDLWEAKYDTLVIKHQIAGPILLDTQLSAKWKETYLKTKLTLPVEVGLWNTKIVVSISDESGLVKTQKIRLNTPKWLESENGEYEFFTKWPNECTSCQLEVKLENGGVDRLVEYFEITMREK